MAGALRDIAVNTVPFETVVTTNPAEFTQLCSADPRRYAIGFLLAGGTSFVTTDPGNIPVGLGIPLSTTQVTWLYAKDVGAFVQRAWFDTTAGGGNVIIVYQLVFPKE